MIKILEQHNFKRGDEGTDSSSDGDEENDDALPSLKRLRMLCPLIMELNETYFAFYNNDYIRKWHC